MSVNRSTDDLRNAGAAPVCGLCNHSITSSGYSYTTQCSHIFHKSCLVKHTKTNQTCPTCGRPLNALSVSTSAYAGRPPSPMTTRSQSHRASGFDAGRTGLPSGPTQANSSPVNNRERENANVSGSIQDSDQHPEQHTNNSDDQIVGGDSIRSIVAAAMNAQQKEMMKVIGEQLSSMIETSVQASLARLSIPSQNPTTRNTQNNTSHVSNASPLEVQTLEQLLGIPVNDGQNSNFSAQPNTNENLSMNNNNNSSSIRPDKVGHIIHNWKIKFSGDPHGISIDNFLYRVEALTKETLNGNFELLCQHISALFESKANEWFWRYHKSVSEIRWSRLCAALRTQYKDSRTDVDWRELIRDRKQRPHESFDSFYEAIIDISDRLYQPLEETVLIEILRRNLLPEIQHEILNIPISSIGQLRDICRRREFFLQDINKRHSFSKPIHPRKQLHELVNDFGDLSENDEVISAISLSCWNCKKAGHRYQDCLEERSIFCFGCGAPNVYKPNCAICHSKNGQSSALKGARRPTKSSSTNTD